MKYRILLFVSVKLYSLKLIKINLIKLINTKVNTKTLYKSYIFLESTIINAIIGKLNF